MFSSNTSQVSSDATFVEDVFSTYLYTGNGTTQTITNGIDLSGKGGLVWVKQRTDTYGHGLIDTVRGRDKVLFSESTSAQQTSPTSGDDLTSFNSNGFSVGANYNLSINLNTKPYASWTFRKQAKFFDVVTYTGDGNAGRQISHALGSVPGCIIIKRTNTTSNWFVYHKDMDGGIGAMGYSANLNLTDPYARTSNTLNDTNPTATTITLGTNAMVNASGGTYVAYLFAHNAGGFGPSGTDSVISCGITGANGATLGWEPQWVLYKDFQNFADWYIFDNMRGVATGGTDAVLFSNSSSAESSSTNWIDFNATGFSGGASGRIFIAIRRGPMKTPTTGTSVFSPVTFTGDGTVNRALTAGFPADVGIPKVRINTGFSGGNTWLVDRLRAKTLMVNGTFDEGTLNAYDILSFTKQQNAVTTGSSTSFINSSGDSQIAWLFRRAPSFMDVVCYTGDSVNNRALNHNLGVAPELIIYKRRSVSADWVVMSSMFPNGGDALFLQSTSAISSNAYGAVPRPTATLFYVRDWGALNNVGDTYVSYLFSSCPGVSKVGSYTGNGSSQTINCGFTGGARFVMIKRTDSTGDWYLWDTARGIVANNDPYLAMNTANVEVTSDDSIDPNSTGFIVNQNAGTTNINASGGTYIYLAIA